MQPIEDLDKSKLVVAIALSRLVSLLEVLFRIYSDLCSYYSIIYVLRFY